MSDVFKRLGISNPSPVILAPLAGVSDHPFRRICQRYGADLTYVEMISATALLYNSKRTLEMLTRHEDEPVLGVQLTAKTPQEMGGAVAKVHAMDFFDTIDINMGCPVQKVVKSGCGSAILKDPQRVYETTKAAVENTDKPVSAKIRLGWDHQSINYLEVADAIAQAKASWITLHGRTRSDDYSDPVHLEPMAELKQKLSIPVIGNGNLFSAKDAKTMIQAGQVDGLMVSRGALGVPWIFNVFKGTQDQQTVDEWLSDVLRHLEWQEEAYKDVHFDMGIVCMRKHLLWYSKGWPGSKKLREDINATVSFPAIKDSLRSFAVGLKESGVFSRSLVEVIQNHQSERFVWDPKFEMNRQLDRGLTDEPL